MKQKLPSSLWLVPLLVPLLMGQTVSSCNTDKRPIVKLSRGEDLVMVDFPLNAGTGAYIADETDPIDEICVGSDKTVCEWNVDPNEQRAFEKHGPSVGPWSDVEGSPGTMENFVRCVSPTTHAGICEPWDALTNGHWNHAAVTMVDRGECSARLSTGYFIDQILNQFQRQSDLRLGEDQLTPAGTDVVMWTDFLFGLKDSPIPFRAWQDHTIGKGFGETFGVFKGESVGEIVIDGNYFVDGNLEWRYDLDRYENLNAGAGLAAVLQTFWYANPLTFWSVFLGQCEKDRPMRVRFRGTFEATENGGVGINVNTRNNCGPNKDGPCTWAHVYPWPARPLCNNQIKPQIEENFVNGIRDGMTDPDTGKPRCLTCTEDGKSLLPFRLRDGSPIPVLRVAMGPKDTEFIFVDDANDPEQRVHLQELSERGMCSFSRSGTTPDPVVLIAGGRSL